MRMECNRQLSLDKRNGRKAATVRSSIRRRRPKKISRAGVHRRFQQPGAPKRAHFASHRDHAMSGCCVSARQLQENLQQIHYTG